MAQHMFSSLGETADRKLHALADTSREKLEAIKKKSLGDLYRDTKGWVRHNPGKTLLGAVTAGILIGWILRRKR
jgi:ElaB/YqjD/DUF883 family membrane-anchored ribosome-binding protein